jgi:prepilin peptidase CpaA
MEKVVQLGVVGVLFALLAYVIYTDLRSRLIANMTNGAIALLALPFWLASGEPLWPLLGWQLLLATGVFAVFALVFAFGAMGGGDVKLLTALALWLPPVPDYVRMLVLMSIIGGALTLGYLVWHRRSGRVGPPEVPYGCAISIAAIATLGEPIVKQLLG